MGMFSELLKQQNPEVMVPDDTIGTALSKGWSSGLRGAGSQLQSVAGMAGELLGADKFAEARYGEAQRLQQEAQEMAPQVSHSSQVDGFKSGLRYAAGLLGGSAPVSLAGIGAAALTGGGAIPAMAAATAASLPFEVGDTLQKQMADPEAMQRPVSERALGALAGGAGSAVLQGIVPGMIGKQLGRGTAGAVGQSFKGTYGRNVLGDFALESGAEGGGDAIKQLGANPDAPLDWESIKENMIGGGVAGAAMGHIGVAADLAHNVAPKAGEMIDSAKTSINERLAAARRGAGEKMDAAAESKPGVKLKSAWDEVSDLAQKGREKFDTTLDKVLNGEELGVNPADWARATTDEAKRRLTELSDNEHIKATKKWGEEMLADAGLDEAKRADIMDAMKNIGDRASQIGIATLRKAWEVTKAGKRKVDEFSDVVSKAYEKSKRRDVDVDAEWVDEPTPELTALGFTSKKAPEPPETSGSTPPPTEEQKAPQKSTIKDYKAYIDARVAEGMSKEEARAAYIESLNSTEGETKLSEDYSGVESAIAQAIKESGIVGKRPELFEDSESMGRMASTLRMVAEQAIRGKLSPEVVDMMVDVFDKHAPHMINTFTRVVAGANLDPKDTDNIFRSINSLNKRGQERGDLHNFLRDSLTDETADTFLSSEIPRLSDTLIRHARGELTAKSTPAEAQAINESIARILKDHFGSNAEPVSKRIEQAAKQFGEPNLERTGGADFSEEVLTDENGAVIEPAEGGFDEDGNRLEEASQNITRFGLSKADKNGNQRNVVGGAMMHKDSQYVDKYLASLREKHSTKDDSGRIVRTAEQNGFDIRFETEAGSEFGHILVENRGNPNEFNQDEIESIRLDGKKHSRSPARLEVGWKVTPAHKSRDSKGVLRDIEAKEGPELIVDATKLATVMRQKRYTRRERDEPIPLRQQIAEAFMEGVNLLTSKYGGTKEKPTPIQLPDELVIAYVNAKPFTWGQARKLDVRTESDRERDGASRRMVAIRDEFAKAAKVPKEKLHTVHNRLMKLWANELAAARGDEMLVAESAPKIFEYVNLGRQAAVAKDKELGSDGRDTQEMSRQRASAQIAAAGGRPASAIRSRQDTAADNRFVEKTLPKETLTQTPPYLGKWSKGRNDGTVTEYGGRSATSTNNDTFSSEMEAREDADITGNIHKLTNKMGDRRPIFGDRRKDSDPLLDAEAIGRDNRDTRPKNDMVHRSNMDGSPHWAGDHKAVPGLATLIGTIEFEWANTPGKPAQKLVERVKKLVSVAASMSAKDADKLRMLAPDPLDSRVDVIYNDKFSSNDSLHDNIKKMTMKQAVKELTRRENYRERVAQRVGETKFVRILDEEIELLEKYLDNGKFGDGGGVPEAMSLGEAAATINELARKYKDVIVRPEGDAFGEANTPGDSDGVRTFSALPASYTDRRGQGEMFPLSPEAGAESGEWNSGSKARQLPSTAGRTSSSAGGDIKVKKGTNQPENPVKFEAGVATNGVRQAEGEAAPKGSPFLRNIMRRLEYLNNPPDTYTPDDAVTHLAWAKERLNSVREREKAATDEDMKDLISDQKLALMTLIKKAESVIEGDESLAEMEGSSDPKGQAPKTGAAGKSGDVQVVSSGIVDSLRLVRDKIRGVTAADKADKATDASLGTGETKQSAQSTSPNVNNAKNYNAKDIRDHIEKVLGKSVKLAWASFTHAGQFDRTKTGDYIRLSIHALDPMSTAYHESLHAFFAQLRDAGATDIIEVLMKAASNEHVIRQLEDKFMNQPAVLKQLKDPEERAAYMYQMWAADPKGFKVSIAARNVFQKIAAFIRKLFGVWSNDERAEHIMNYFHEGKYAQAMGSPSAVRHALMETHRNKILDTAAGFAKPLGELADAVVGAGGDRLRNTGIPALQQLADIIKREATRDGGDQGFVPASRIEATKMRTMLGDIVGGMSEEQSNDLMESLQSNTPAKTPEARLKAKEVKEWLRSIHGYMKEAGVSLGDLGPDYFPRVWDTHYISKNQKAFRDMLEPYIRRGEMKGTADSLISRLISRGGSDLGIGADLREVNQPGMQHTKERMLAFITPADAAQFVEKNLHATLNSYIEQTARKAEWSRRLGKGKLEQILTDAKAQGATQKDLDLADDYMKGVDGTLGDKMNPTARRLVGNMIVYQNIRLLPMAAFSMIVDPLGVMVRGGNINDAWGTFKRGMKGIVDTFKKDGGQGTDPGTEWAELVGVVDSAMMSHVMGDIYSQGMVGGTAQKINNAFFKYNFVEGLNRNFRIGATEAAVRFIARHAIGLDGLGSSVHSRRWMRELGLRKGDVVHMVGPNGARIAMTEADGLTPEQVVRVHAAINQWVDGAVLRPDAADKPIWMNDPHWALIAHLKQFVFTFQKVILGRVMHEIRHGNYTPMMVLASYVPVMIAADTAKGLLQGGGDTPEWKKGWDVSDYVGYGIQRAGLLGVGQFGFDVISDTGRGGSGIGELTGPTIEQFTEVLGSFGGHRSLGSTVIDALPANALYKGLIGGEADGGPMHTS